MMLYSGPGIKGMEAILYSCIAFSLKIAGIMLIVIGFISPRDYVIMLIGALVLLGPLMGSWGYRLGRSKT